MNEQTTIELQEKIAYLEKTVSDLDDVVRQLNDRVDQVEQRLSTLRTQFDQHLTELHEPNLPSGEPRGQGE